MEDSAKWDFEDLGSGVFDCSKLSVGAIAVLDSKGP